MNERNAKLMRLWVELAEPFSVSDNFFFLLQNYQTSARHGGRTAYPSHNGRRVAHFPYKNCEDKRMVICGVAEKVELSGENC